MGMGETKQAISVDIDPMEPAEGFSLEEFDALSKLFDCLLDELERRDAHFESFFGAADRSIGFDYHELDPESYLDEFDLAEIEKMRACFGLNVLQAVEE